MLKKNQYKQNKEKAKNLYLSLNPHVKLVNQGHDAWHPDIGLINISASMDNKGMLFCGFCVRIHQE